MASLRETILNAADITEKLVHVPEWGVDVMVRALSGLERAQFIKAAAGPDGRIDPERGYPAIVISTAREVVEAENGLKHAGELIFTPADRDALMGKSGAALERIANVALTISGLAPDAVENAAKN